MQVAQGDLCADSGRFVGVVQPPPLQGGGVDVEVYVAVVGEGLSLFDVALPIEGAEHSDERVVVTDAGFPDACTGAGAVALADD